MIEFWLQLNFCYDIESFVILICEKWTNGHVNVVVILIDKERLM